MYNQKAKGKKALETIAVILVLLIAAATCALAASPRVMLPGFLKYGLYGVAEGSDNGIIKNGSAVLTKKNADVSESDHIIVIFDGMPKIERAGNISAEKAEKIIYRIDNLGAVAEFLHNIRIAVWVFWAICLVPYIVLKATEKTRNASKNRKKLLRTFEYYGKVYDELEDKEDY